MGNEVYLTRTSSFLPLDPVGNDEMEAVLGMVGQSLPQFVSRFKNTNLLVAGLRMISTMPSQLGDLRGAWRDFKRATDKAAAQAALARFGSAAGSLQQSTQAAFQKEGTT
jgi:hypothetical protein